MTVRVHVERDLNASLEEVAQVLLSEDFRNEVCRAQEVVEHSVSITEGADGPEVSIDQEQAVRNVPSMVRKLVGETIKLRQVERWTSAEHAEATLSITEQDATLHGTVDLAATSGDTTQQLIAWEVKVSIPLVGRKVESIVSDLLHRALEVEGEVLTDWLSRTAD